MMINERREVMNVIDDEVLLAKCKLASRYVKSEKEKVQEMAMRCHQIFLDYKRLESYEIDEARKGMAVSLAEVLIEIQKYLFTLPDTRELEELIGEYVDEQLCKLKKDFEDAAKENAAWEKAVAEAQSELADMQERTAAKVIAKKEDEKN